MGERIREIEVQVYGDDETAPRSKDLVGRYPGIQVNMVQDPQFLARLQKIL